MIALDILLDGLFAAVAAVGFGAISDPPMRAFPRIALLAAAGHALRFSLMNYAGVDIATASLAAAVTIGMGSLWLGRGIRCPMTVLYIPALLPMVPGMFAYKAIRDGAHGVDMGRNIFQSDCPAGMAQAIGKIVHEGYTPSQAYEVYQEIKHNK